MWHHGCKGLERRVSTEQYHPDRHGSKRLYSNYIANLSLKWGLHFRWNFASQPHHGPIMAPVGSRWMVDEVDVWCGDVGMWFKNWERTIKNQELTVPIKQWKVHHQKMGFDHPNCEGAILPILDLTSTPDAYLLTSIQMKRHWLTWDLFWTCAMSILHFFSGFNHIVFDIYRHGTRSRQPVKNLWLMTPTVQIFPASVSPSQLFPVVWADEGGHAFGLRWSRVWNHQRNPQ